MTREISNNDDVIDSRDVIERIAELEYIANEAVNIKLSDEERAELQVLRYVAEQGEQYSEDWRYGATLVREDYFVTYARDFAEEIGAIPDDAQWPATCIDWAAAAKELKVDYDFIDFDGVSYLIR